MPTPDLKVTIDAEAAKFEAGVERARRATMRMEDQLRKADLAAASLDKQLADEAAQAAQQRADSMEKLGRSLVTFGAATLAGLGLAAKAAIDWESSWAGVRKTVDGSDEELARLETELRGLATTLPATHQEIAAVAEAAGQLGVRTKDISQFTRVMIDLGETTNLTADEAATAIAQLMNVMQTAPDQVDNLGSALVALGNNGASTEKDILEMAQRIAAAGEQVGMSEADVLGFANALASLGVEAEAGGSAISRVMADMAKAVAQGGDKLSAFADVAGMSAEEFAASFRTDPAEAIATFVSGLGRIQAAGGDVFTTLDDLSLGEIRVRDALLRMASSGDLLRESLELGATAWSENSALAEEAAKRYETTEAKIQIAKNTLVDLAIDIGSVLLPTLAAVAESVADVAKWFSDLPGPVKTVATVLAAVAGVVTLLAGGFLLLAPRIAAAQAVMVTMARTSPVLAGGLMTIGGLLGKLTVGLGAAAAAWGLLELASEDFTVGTGAAAEAMQNLARGETSELIDRIAELHGELDDADRWLGIIPKHLSGWDMSAKNAKEVTDEFAASVGAVDQVLATLVSSGDIEGAREAVQLLGERIGLSGDEMDAFTQEHLPLYVDAVAAAGVEAESSSATQEYLQASLEAVGGEAQDAAAQLEEYLNAVRRATDPVFALNDALVGVESAQAAYNQAVEEYGTASPEAEQAAIGLMSAIGDLESAALNGELSFGDFEDKLDQWVAAGDITAEQADAIKGRVAALRGEAEDYQGRYDATITQRGAEAAARAAIVARTEAVQFRNRNQPYMARMGVDRKPQQRGVEAAIKDMRGWGKRSNSARLGVHDRASGTMRYVVGLLSAIRSKTVTVHTIYKQTGVIPKASGGAVSAGASYLVGEQGPELITPMRDGFVHTASATARMLSSASSVTVPVGGGVVMLAPEDRALLIDVASRVTRLTIGEREFGQLVDETMTRRAAFYR